MVLVFFSVAAPRFFTLLNRTNILVQNSYLIIAFIVAGIFVAIASVVLTARTGSASAGIAVDAMFTCFTACVLGGISFSGGGGNVLNVVLGVLILGMLGNGMQMMGLSIYSQYIAKGVLLVVAIAYDNYQKAQKLKEA